MESTHKKNKRDGTLIGVRETSARKGNIIRRRQRTVRSGAHKRIAAEESLSVEVDDGLGSFDDTSPHPIILTGIDHILEPKTLSEGLLSLPSLCGEIKR